MKTPKPSLQTNTLIDSRLEVKPVEPNNSLANSPNSKSKPIKKREDFLILHLIN